MYTRIVLQMSAYLTWLMRFRSLNNSICSVLLFEIETCFQII